MCHPEVPPGTPLPDVRVEDALIPVKAGERMPALVALPERTPAPTSATTRRKAAASAAI